MIVLKMQTDSSEQFTCGLPEVVCHWFHIFLVFYGYLTF